MNKQIAILITLFWCTLAILYFCLTYRCWRAKQFVGIELDPARFTGAFGLWDNGVGLERKDGTHLILSDFMRVTYSNLIITDFVGFLIASAAAIFTALTIIT